MLGVKREGRRKGGGGGYLGCGAWMNECMARERGTLMLKMSSLLKHKRVRAHALFCAESHTCVDLLHKYTWFFCMYITSLETDVNAEQVGGFFRSNACSLGAILFFLQTNNNPESLLCRALWILPNLAESTSYCNLRPLGAGHGTYVCGVSTSLGPICVV